MQRVVEVLEVAVDEFRRVAPVPDHDAFRQEASSSVAVAVAPGTSGIGNVRTGRSPCHSNVVEPFTPAAACRSSRLAGFCANARRRSARRGRDRGLRRAVRARPQTDPSLLQRGGPGVALPSPATISAPGMSSSHAYGPLIVSTLEYVWPFARRHSICDRVAGGLVVGLEAKLRQRAGLPVHLNRALAVVVERAHELGLGLAPQHPHGPRPIEEHGLQVFGAGLGRVAAARAPATPPRPRHPARRRAARSHRGDGERARRDRSSKDITPPSQRPASSSVPLVDTRLNSLSPSSTRRMNPAGFPFLAGRAVILRLSPGLIEVLLSPCRVSVWMEAVVSIHSVVVPSAFGTARCEARVRIHEVQLRELALQHDLLIQVVHPRYSVMCLSSAPTIRNPHKTTSRAIRELIVGTP